VALSHGGSGIDVILNQFPRWIDPEPTLTLTTKDTQIIKDQIVLKRMKTSLTVSTLSEKYTENQIQPKVISR
jgi:hypothetical protein